MEVSTPLREYGRQRDDVALVSYMKMWGAYTMSPGALEHDEASRVFRGVVDAVLHPVDYEEVGFDRTKLPRKYAPILEANFYDILKNSVKWKNLDANDAKKLVELVKEHIDQLSLRAVINLAKVYKTHGIDATKKALQAHIKAIKSATQRQKTPTNHQDK